LLGVGSGIMTVVTATSALAEPRPPDLIVTRVHVPAGPFVDCGEFVSTAEFDVTRTDRWRTERTGDVHVVDLSYRGVVAGPAANFEHEGRTVLTYDLSAGTVNVVGLGRNDVMPAGVLVVHDSAAEVLAFAARDVLRTTSPRQLREADYGDMCRRLGGGS